MSPQPEHLVETSLVVSDLERARSFYERVFGLETVIADNGVIGLQLPDSTVLLLFSAATTYSSHHTAAAPHVRFAVPRGMLADWDRHLIMQGIVVESRKTGHDGASSLFFRDPGYRILAHRLNLCHVPNLPCPTVGCILGKRVITKRRGPLFVAAHL